MNNEGLSETDGPFPVPRPRDNRERNDDQDQREEATGSSAVCKPRLPSIIVTTLTMNNYSLTISRRTAFCDGNMGIPKILSDKFGLPRHDCAKGARRTQLEEVAAATLLKELNELGILLHGRIQIRSELITPEIVDVESRCGAVV